MLLKQQLDLPRRSDCAHGRCICQISWGNQCQSSNMAPSQNLWLAYHIVALFYFLWYTYVNSHACDMRKWIWFNMPNILCISVYHITILILLYHVIVLCFDCSFQIIALILWQTLANTAKTAHWHSWKNWKVSSFSHCNVFQVPTSTSSNSDNIDRLAIANAAQSGLLTWLLPSNALPYFDKELSRIRIRHFDQKQVDVHHSRTFSCGAYVLTYRINNPSKAEHGCDWCSEGYYFVRVMQLAMKPSPQPRKSYPKAIGREEWHSSKGRNQNLSQHVTATSVHTTRSWVEDSIACNSSTFSNPSIRGRGQRRERGGRCEGRESGERLLNWKSSQRWGKECRDMPIPDSYFYPKCHPKDLGQ